MDNDTPRLLIFGLGYSGEALARRLLPQGWRIRGTSREPRRLAALRAMGIEAVAFEGNTPFGAGALDDVSHVLVAVPPGEHGDPVLEQFGGPLASCRSLRWIGYLSTTGIYGDSGGDWVDEDTAPAPTNERGRRRVAAEQAWQSLGRRIGVPAQVFRLAGIYGPGRSVLDDVRGGTARRIDKPGQYFSRIHVVDIANVLEHAMSGPSREAVYNVCDDEPAPSAEVVEYACALLDTTPPPAVPFAAIEKTLSPMALEFWSNNRRVRNERIKRELGVRLLFPDYRAGLKAVLELERGR